MCCRREKNNISLLGQVIVSLSRSYVAFVFGVMLGCFRLQHRSRHTKEPQGKLTRLPRCCHGSREASLDIHRYSTLHCTDYYSPHRLLPEGRCSIRLSYGRIHSNKQRVTSEHRIKRASLITQHLSLKSGRGERIRTSDPLVPNQVLYQAEPRPDNRR
jgi:hypothetical protein